MTESDPKRCEPGKSKDSETVTLMQKQVRQTIPGGDKQNQTSVHLQPLVYIQPSRTPWDVLRWLKDFHNSFHQGSSETIVEFFEKTERVEAGFTVFRQRFGQIRLKHMETIEEMRV